jgi:hypothetical protein
LEDDDGEVGEAVDLLMLSTVAANFLPFWPVACLAGAFLIGDKVFFLTGGAPRSRDLEEDDEPDDEVGVKVSLERKKGSGTFFCCLLGALRPITPKAIGLRVMHASRWAECVCSSSLGWKAAVISVIISVSASFCCFLLSGFFGAVGGEREMGERHGVLLEEMAAAWSSAFLCVRMLCVCVSTKALSSSDFQSTLN